VSIPSNIAEGQGRMLHGEFRQFLGHARGSLLELETQVLIAQRLSFVNTNDAQRVLDQASEIKRIVHGLAESLMEPATRN
jgi:four helix bundle protein